MSNGPEMVTYLAGLEPEHRIIGDEIGGIQAYSYAQLRAAYLEGQRSAACAPEGATEAGWDGQRVYIAFKNMPYAADFLERLRAAIKYVASESRRHRHTERSNSMSDHYILEGKAAKKVDLMTWARWYEKGDRRVAEWRDGKVYVSTVFLGLDHSYGDGPPMLYETMVFGGEHDQWQERCSTWDEAEKMHERAVKLVSGQGGDMRRD